MPRKKSKAVSEDNGPVRQDKSGLGGLTMEEIRRIFFEELDKCFDEWTSYFVQRLKDTKKKSTKQRLARLEQEARPSRLATEEADVESDKRKRTEGASAAD